MAFLGQLGFALRTNLPVSCILSAVDRKPHDSLVVISLAELSARRFASYRNRNEGGLHV